VGKRGLVAMVLVVVPLALLAAGCGGSSGSSAPATTTTAGASGVTGAGNAALTAFTSCLKQHGITTTGFGGFGGRPRGATGRFGPTGASGRRFGPSGASGRFGPTGASGRRGGGFLGRNLTAAQQKAFTACRSKLPAGTGGFRTGGGGGAGGAGANPAFAKYTQCLAKHGVKFGTASASGAAFAKASKACAKLRPAVGGAASTTTTG
jgi:hypothetical protein